MSLTVFLSLILAAIFVVALGAIRSEGIDFLAFGRLRPLHTNAAILAFVGNMMFAGIYYSTQRLCKARMASDFFSGLHFWGWQLIIVAATITLPAGLALGKEYAELIWPVNIAVATIWVVFALNFFLTLHRRNEPSLYVALWFYIATIITVAMLYIVNHLWLPTSLTHSYPVFGGVQDALVQWWYGHNAVAFFLTTPIVGIMYYFMPEAADRPIYSQRMGWFQGVIANQPVAWTLPGIARDLKDRGAFVDPESQMVAVIAYLQKLGHYTDQRTGSPFPPPALLPPVAAAMTAPLASPPPAPVSAAAATQ